jgi:hypothetical protein
VKVGAAGSRQLKTESGKAVPAWKAPKAAGCYKVTAELKNGRSLSMFFKVK